MHARIENGAVVEYPIVNLFQRLPDVSLPADLSNDATLPEGFVYVHVTAIPEFDRTTQKVVEVDPAFIGGRWCQQYNVIELPLAEQEEQRSIYLNERKAQRRTAYEQEADPLFFKWQRGEATKEEWLAKVQEIRSRFPG